MIFHSLESLKFVYGARTTREGSIVELYEGHRLILLENPFDISIIDINTKKRVPVSLEFPSDPSHEFPLLAYNYLKYARIENRDLVFIVGHAAIPEKRNIFQQILLIGNLVAGALQHIKIVSFGELPSNIEGRLHGLAVLNDAGLFFTFRYNASLHQVKMGNIK